MDDLLPGDVELDMDRLPGMRAMNRRLARLGVEFVDMTHCDHGHGCEASAQVGRASRSFTVHGSADPVAAIGDLCEQIEVARRGTRRRNR